MIIRGAFRKVIGKPGIWRVSGHVESEDNSATLALNVLINISDGDVALCYDWETEPCQEGLTLWGF